MAERCADLDACGRRTAAIYRRDESLTLAYRGGMPAGFMAASAMWDSDGLMGAPGDPRLGEVGIFQISAHTEEEYGVPDGTRRTKTGNYFLAGVDYACEAVRVRHVFHLDGVANEDLYKLARLVYSIGRPGAYIILRMAKVDPGPNYYDRLIEWADMAKAAGILPTLGSQKPAKVHYRIVSVETTWQVAIRSGVSMDMRDPILPPNPPNLATFKVPKDIRGMIRQLTGGERIPPPIEPIEQSRRAASRVFAFVIAAVATVATVAGAVILTRPKIRKPPRS